MIELISASVGLADKILDVHKIHHREKYRKKLARLIRDLENELNQPDHLKIDSVIDDLNFELCLLLNIFCQEITSSNMEKKDVPTLH